VEKTIILYTSIHIHLCTHLRAWKGERKKMKHVLSQRILEAIDDLLQQQENEMNDLLLKGENEEDERYRQES